MEAVTVGNEVDLNASNEGEGPGVGGVVAAAERVWLTKGGLQRPGRAQIELRKVDSG